VTLHDETHNGNARIYTQRNINTASEDGPRKWNEDEQKMHDGLNEQVGLLNVSPKSRESQRKETGRRAGKTMMPTEQKFREKRFLCAQGIIPAGPPPVPEKLSLSVVSPARRDFNVARAANARARTGLACSRPRNNSRRCRAQPPDVRMAIENQAKGKETGAFYLRHLRGEDCGKNVKPHTHTRVIAIRRTRAHAHYARS